LGDILAVVISVVICVTKPNRSLLLEIC